jgi:hypothetical protein
MEVRHAKKRENLKVLDWTTFMLESHDTPKGKKSLLAMLEGEASGVIARRGYCRTFDEILEGKKFPPAEWIWCPERSKQVRLAIRKSGILR